MISSDLQMTTKASNLAELYAMYGQAAYLAQCFEGDLTAILLALKGLNDATPSLEELERFDARNIRKTLGALLNDLHGNVSLDSDVAELFADALAHRNRLVHHFYREHATDMLSDAGRDMMITEIRQMTETFTAAVATAKSFSDALGKALGITEELLDKTWREMTGNHKENENPNNTSELTS